MLLKIFILVFLILGSHVSQGKEQTRACENANPKCYQFLKPFCYQYGVQLACRKLCGLCDVQITSPPPVTTLLPIDQPIDQGDVPCGKRGGRYRIIGGQNALPGSWPWQVQIAYSSPSSNVPHQCGGSIITPEWILTAAHCFLSDVNIDHYIFTAGEHDRSRKEGYEQKKTSKKLILHPYNELFTANYDLALVKLTTPIDYNKYVRPVCLPQTDFEPGTSCYISGWGDLYKNKTYAQILQQAQLPLVSRETCMETYKDYPINVTQQMRCAGYGRDSKTAPCQGDSGGPLVCIRDNTWFLMGVTSWSKDCSQEGHYAVYADMMALKYWVQKTINEN
ncbi:chymotrypsinogen A-like isoform X1 [Montipora capricornis]|uniref:chymotrypsinogen A-like isoform X1 n=1 Tax=Montipora foliosa TaxID=591990 RepID=UPI0035F15E00